MALSLFGRQFREQTADGDGGAPRKTPAQINAERNRDRLARISEIGDTADGNRAEELVDVEGERVVGRFQGGELDDSDAARAARTRRENDEAAQAAEEQREREAEAERLEQEEARRLQAEGGEPEGEDGGTPARGDRTAQSREPADSSEDEKVVDGVRYYRTIVAGSEKWLTLTELRNAATASANAEETLQRAQDALQRATHPEPSPKPAPGEVDDKDLENIILSAGMGDEEAVKKLVSVIKGRQPGATPQDVSRLVSQQIATQREVDSAEREQQEILGNSNLEPVFRVRLAQFAQAKPKTRIKEAYKLVGDQMRKDFAPMLKPTTPPPPSKAERKRTIVNPPQSAGRQQQREDDDREVPVSETIDALARARGQQRAHRIRRS